MKKLSWLREYFKRYFPDYAMSGTAVGGGWHWCLSKGRTRATIIRKGHLLCVGVQINNKFYYPKSLNEAFQILKNNLV